MRLCYEILVLKLILLIRVNASYHVEITNNAPIVLGATVQFKAELFEKDGSILRPPTGIFRFDWKDNAIPSHEGSFEGDFATSTWNTTYSKELYGPGWYTVQVTVYKKFFFFYSIASRRQDFNITSFFNGKLGLTQSNTTVQGPYVSSTTEVIHKINLNEADAQFINTSATQVITYWFVDCIYYGMTTDLTFAFNYTDAVDQDRDVKALVVASDLPLTTLPPSTLPTLIPNISTTTPSSPIPNITTVAPNSTKFLEPVSKISLNSTVPFVCLNSSIIPPDPSKTYGYFFRTLKVKAPVSNIVVSGARWLHDGELLNLGVSCNGSSPYTYCVDIIPGEYNVTGNETCHKERLISECQLNISHYFRTTNMSTVVIIIKNEVTKKIASAVINIYKVAKQPQLSVIIVPVSCCALAVVFIVFGIAYYVQSRKRYTIEVADFDFSQASDMEYMTFTDRLKDSINRALNRTRESGSEGSIWSPNQKYNSM